MTLFTLVYVLNQGSTRRSFRPPPNEAKRLAAEDGAVAGDELVRGRVVPALELLGGEIGENALREHLAELHSPLVEAVDVPWYCVSTRSH